MTKFGTSLVMIVVVSSLLIFGISQAEEKKADIRNVLIEQYGLEDSEMLDSFILEFQPTEEDLEEFNVKAMFELYAEVEDNKEYDFSYLFEEVANNMKFELSTHKIANVAFSESHDSGERRALLFVVEDKKIYYDDSIFYDDIREAEVVSLNDEKTEMLVNTLSMAEDWQSDYESPGQPGVMDGWSGWRLSIELADGRIRQFKGSGQGIDHYPENYIEVRDSLWAIVQ